MNHVFVVDTNKQPLSLCHPARARALLREGRAAVLRRFPFTLVMKEAYPNAVVRAVTVKLDPGSKTTGIALLNTEGRVLFAAELTHRGQAIKDALESRRALRRGRRNRNTRYRAARFNNRCRATGWLSPSLQHRKDAAAVNATRNAIFIALLNTGLPVEAGTGAETKFNRKNQQLPKTHWIDAACVGQSGANVTLDATMQPLIIKATGHGNRQMCGTNRYGFPVRHRMNQKKHFGFETGDQVVATVPGADGRAHIKAVCCVALQAVLIFKPRPGVSLEFPIDIALACLERMGMRTIKYTTKPSLFLPMNKFRASRRLR